MEKEYNISVLMNTKYMYQFLMRHTYFSISGLIGICFSLAALVIFIFFNQTLTNGQKVLLVFGALLFTVINPLKLWISAMKQTKLNPMFQKPVIYSLKEEEIIVSQGEEVLPIKWEDVAKVIETKEVVTIYLSKVRAFVLPKEFYRDEVSSVKEMIQNKVDESICKWYK